MIIAQMTDLHITAEGKLAYGQVDTASALEKAVAHVLSLDPAPDLILLSGDIGDAGLADEYALVAEILAPINIPYFMIPGNHDRRENLRAAFPVAVPVKAGDFSQYVIDDYPLRIIALDTLDEGYGHGRLCSSRLAWLDRQLAAKPAKPTLIFMHHPPIISGIAHMDALRLLPGKGHEAGRAGLEGAKGLAAVLAEHRQVVGITCGHLHRPIHCLWQGVPVNVAPSVAHQVVADFRVDGLAAFNMEPPAMQLHFWSEDMPEQGLLTHTSYIGSFAGPFPFSTRKAD